MKTQFAKLGFIVMCCSSVILTSCLRNEDGWERTDLGLVVEPEFPNGDAPVSESARFVSGVEVSVRDGKYFLGDDMILTDLQVRAMEDIGMPGVHQESPKSADGRCPIAPRTGLWWYPDSAVSRSHAQNPYAHNLWSMVRIVYAPDLPDNLKSAARMAMIFWQSRTNVRFYNATGEPTEDSGSGIKYPYLYFCPGDATASYVGQIGGKQELYISPTNGSFQAIAHEIGHALGMYHEHMRADRDRDYANKFFLPFIARIDNYLELDAIVYDADNRQLSEAERVKLQADLNNGVSVPPAWGRIPNNL